MPLNKNIKKVLVIGSGPIVIGQAAEFDYAGTQACRVLKQEGIEIVLINSNPATIMTDNNIADIIYIEPLTLETVKRVIKKERPDSILSGLGGQTGLTLSMQLAKSGFLDKYDVKLLGSLPETIDRAEDRQIFKDTMLSIGQPCVPSAVTTDLEDAVIIAKRLGFPVIIRPAFTMGGAGGGIAKDEKQFREIASNGLMLSPINQILVEKSIAGWKEIEFEVMRDSAGNAIIVCSMENFDPVGIHTGDSYVIAPAVTLSDREYQMLRTASLDIVESLGVEGGCNVQLALNPDNFDYAVIEVNPRVSRSSALASKATGYPIAKVATKVAIGYTLDEIKNAVTGTTYAAFEPTLDYVAVKLPRWPFDKFVYANNELGTQMKATGEVMSIADTFEEALLKAVRGAELGLTDLNMPKLAKVSNEQLHTMMVKATDERLFAVYEAMKRGLTIDQLFEITKIDRWFLHALKRILDADLTEKSNPAIHTPNKKVKFETELPQTDKLIYKMVDTCAAEFEAKTPYFYSITQGTENEALPFIAKSKKKRIVVLGSGPIRIGQGIEFDYACVHSVWTLKKMGYEVIVINNNPETVSTDFDTADRLYFEPLYIEDVMRIIEIEKPIGVICAFGGGTAIKLANKLAQRGVNIIGTSADIIDTCEDRERFEDLLERLDIKRPKGYAIKTLEEALESAKKLGFPVLMRPSYVLGGQNMIIAFNQKDVAEYMEIILRKTQDNPILIDKYLMGQEIEVDAICDGNDILLPGIMEHVERTGVHSGDSIAVYPPPNVDDRLSQRIYDLTKKICNALDVRGLLNIQYVLYEGEIYVIEVNPRASRTVPYISKVTGIPMCELATRVSVGEKLKDLGYKSGFAKVPPYTAVKVPVFSFEKLVGLDTHLGPEMKSTGEVLGIGKNLEEALYKGLLAAGYKMKKQRDGGVFISVRDSDKPEIVNLAEKFIKLGFTIYSTKGTANFLKEKGITAKVVEKIKDCPKNNTENLLQSGKVQYVISTSERGRDPLLDDVKIRRKAVMLGIPCLTSIDTATALANSMLSNFSEFNTELVDINQMRTERLKLPFTKMHGLGNDYIYIDCLDGKWINGPESLAVTLSDRNTGIGGDGVVLIAKSEVADAKMRMYNLDGSESNMCGNAIRCVGAYLYNKGIVKKTDITIETLAGIKELDLITKNGIVSSVKVNMGKADLSPEKIPVRLKANKDGAVINKTIEVGGKEYNITTVSMGNPHAVIFVDNVAKINLEKVGPLFEYNELFPERVNTEFVEIVGKNRLKMRVWERGSGETKACGTGACAVAVASVLNGHCDKSRDILIELPGGILKICCNDFNNVYMTGGASKVYEGQVEI
ncbi:MAG: carbamoyl-phosphate synthase large subunit [Firmicutes bacterium]|nr:carbamoyl-phosphate synthase large subunit [Bacillota bacterium]